jgi:hypothetical protein
MTRTSLVGVLAVVAGALVAVYVLRMLRSGGRQRLVLTEGRIRVHATLLLIGLWGGAAVLLTTPGLIARNGQPKGGDFVHFWTMGRLVHEGQAAALYDAAAYDALVARELPAAAGLHYLPVYAPQTALLFEPLGALPYLTAWFIWTILTLVVYAACVWVVWRECRNLREWGRLTTVLALAFPPLWYLVLDGQTSAILLAAFVLIWRSLERGRPFLAGLALSLIFHKPQLGVASAVLFVLCRQWAVVGGTVLGIAAQFALAGVLLGGSVLRDYVMIMTALPTAGAVIEPTVWQMHSLRAFFLLLLPWRPAAEAAYVVAAGACLGIAVRTWALKPPIRVAMAQLLLTSALVAPHLFVYNLAVVAPALLVIEDLLQARQDPEWANRVHWMVYGAFALPLFGVVAAVTHVQLSVLAMAALSWLCLERSQFAAPVR